MQKSDLYNKTKQQLFTEDLDNFIKGHPYYKEHEDQDQSPIAEDIDTTVYGLHDPDGDYEQIVIKVIHIA